MNNFLLVNLKKSLLEIRKKDLWLKKFILQLPAENSFFNFMRDMYDKYEFRYGNVFEQVLNVYEKDKYPSRVNPR